MVLKRTRIRYKDIEGLPEGSVILTGGLAFQCSGTQDGKKVWDAAGISTSYTTGTILDIARRQKFLIQVLYVAPTENE